MAGAHKSSHNSGKNSAKGSGHSAAARKLGRGSTKPMIEGITKGCIRRLARRGGVKRISGFIYPYSRQIIMEFMEKLLRDATVYTTHGKRKTVTSMDIILAMKRNGKALLGFHGDK